MLTLIALTLAAAAPAGGSPLTLHGECIYPPKLAEALPDAIQLICDTVEVTPNGVDFQRRGWVANFRNVPS
jgi:hypothetical protein